MVHTSQQKVFFSFLTPFMLFCASCFSCSCIIYIVPLFFSNILQPQKKLFITLFDAALKLELSLPVRSLHWAPLLFPSFLSGCFLLSRIISFPLPLSVWPLEFDTIECHKIAFDHLHPSLSLFIFDHPTKRVPSLITANTSPIKD